MVDIFKFKCHDKSILSLKRFWAKSVVLNYNCPKNDFQKYFYFFEIMWSEKTYPEKNSNYKPTFSE